MIQRAAQVFATAIADGYRALDHQAPQDAIIQFELALAIRPQDADAQQGMFEEAQALQYAGPRLQAQIEQLAQLLAED